jgi:dimethylamine monooxygenase subunit A
MGLRPLEIATWFEVDGWRSSDLLQKQILLATLRDRVVACLDRSFGAQEELWSEVVQHLSRHHPAVIEERGRMLVDRATGIVADDVDPIVRAASLVQEDLCVLEDVDGRWTLSAACVCFPSRWSLASKIGTTLDEIHDPVPHYGRDLAAPVNRFFERLTPEKPMWRLNWSVLETGELSLPDPAARHDKDSIDSIDELWFRVERQTLRRLPLTGAIVFTIRTYVNRLTDVLEHVPASREALLTAFETVDHATASYKGWSGLLSSLPEWLSVAEPGILDRMGDEYEQG